MIDISWAGPKMQLIFLFIAYAALAGYFLAEWRHGWLPATDGEWLDELAITVASVLLALCWPLSAPGLRLISWRQRAATSRELRPTGIGGDDD